MDIDRLSLFSLEQTVTFFFFFLKDFCPFFSIRLDSIGSFSLQSMFFSCHPILISPSCGHLVHPVEFALAQAAQDGVPFFCTSPALLTPVLFVVYNAC